MEVAREPVAVSFVGPLRGRANRAALSPFRSKFVTGGCGL
jgi:hypothetical protein